jgi:hypothetical protein
MRHTPRNSVSIVRRLVVASGLGLAIWLGAAPTAAQVPTVPGRECENVPSCKVKKFFPFQLGGWDTLAWDFYCKGEYPFFWAFSYTQTGYASVSNIATSSDGYPSWVGILFTNWNPFQTDDVTVTIACSRDNKWAGDCGPGILDPGYPQVGTEKDYCRNTRSIPVCIQAFEERDPTTGQLYKCQSSPLFSWCQPCPG